MQKKINYSTNECLKIAKQILGEKFDKNDVLYAIAEVLKKSIPEAKFATNITKSENKKFVFAIKKRAKGMPFSKIFKKAYFYGEEFFVTKNVLSPRQETEILVEETIKLASKNSKIFDLCTGSGCVAISIAINSKAEVWASDISKKALKVAKQNAKRLKAKVNFVQSNLFVSLKNEKFDIIVSNPPYIKKDDINLLDTEVKKFDPILALDGGKSGFDFYEKIINEAPFHLTKKGKLLFEVGINQAQTVKKLLQKNFTNIKILKDYNGIERVVIATLNQ